jgi:DNA repair protein SbcC/Rad50
MNIYPSIFSLTTIGLRNHYNQDYLFHPQRTDFTGDNGVGKSIIADVMQLILVGRSSMWRAGTDGTDDKKRQVRTMPLDDPNNPFAYAFLNVQRGESEFVVIGVYIPTNKAAVRPFIIHRNTNNDGTLYNLDTPLLCEDFLIDNRIPDHKELEKNFASQGINFQSFYHSEEVREYHSILYKNKILPYDLSADNTLKMFAEVVQSFSRAKTLNINKSKSLKDFLFSKDKSVYENYLSEKDRLVHYIQDYNAAEHKRIQLIKKQTSLTRLETFLQKKNNSHFDWLLCDTALAFQKKQRTEAEIASLEKQVNELNSQLESLNKSISKLDEAISNNEKERDEKQNNVNILSQLIGKKAQKQAVESSLGEKAAKLQESREQLMTTQNRIEELKSSLDEKNEQLPELQQHEEYWQKEYEKLKDQEQALRPLEQLVEKYGDLNSIRFKIQEQQTLSERRKKFDKLKNIEQFEAFEKSEWAKDFEAGEQFYLQQSAELPKKIEQLNELIGIYEQKNPDSVFDWALNRKQAFTAEEEAVIMHLKDVSTKKLDAKTGNRFVLSVDNLLQHVEKADGGVWLQLGELREFIPYPEKRLLEKPEHFAEVIEKDKAQLQEKLQSLKNELNQLHELKKSLSGLGFSKEYLNIYKEKEELLSFRPDEELPSMYEFDKLLENQFLYQERKSLRTKLQEAQKQWSEFFRKRDKTEETINQLLREHKDAVEKVGQLTETVVRLEGEHAQQRIQLDELASEIEKLSNQLTADVAEENYDKVSAQLKSAVEKLREKVEADKKLSISKRMEANTVDQKRATLQGSLTEKHKTFSFLKYRFEEKATAFEKYTDEPFDEKLAPSQLNDQLIEEKELTKNKSLEAYRSEFNQLRSAFPESEKSPEVEANEYDYETLERILLGERIKHKTNISTELDQLNEEMKEIAKKQIRFVADVFKDVEREYNKCKRIVARLNAFFESQSISKDFHVRVEFEADKNLHIDWIEQLRKQANFLNIESDGGLFFNDHVRPEVIIENIAKKHCDLPEIDIQTLVDAKNYFNLEVSLLDAEKKKYGGSTGQAYMVLALLCIGRLSIVEEPGEEMRAGIRFIIIEELANLDDTNFGIFPKIAQNFGYQLITMTPKPYGSVTEDGWYLHMLTRGTRRVDINEKPYSVLRKENVVEELKAHYFREGKAKAELF